MGEASGEEHASRLVPAIAERCSDVEIEAIGGASLEKVGAKVIETGDDLSVVGLAEGIRSLPTHLRKLNRIRDLFSVNRYDLVILVDYPGFHLKVASAAARNGVPVLYYIAPQLWAWGSWRIRKLRKYVSKLAVVLPFEEQYFRDRGVDTTFVGHPLLDREPPPKKEDARASLNLGADTKILGLFPGSRRSEIDRLWPIFRDTAVRTRNSNPGISVVVGAIEGCLYEGAKELGFVLGSSRLAVAASDVALCKSGTITLEAAIANTPMVIAYKVHPVTYTVARLVVTVRNIGLVNVLARSEVSPELLQAAANPANLAKELQSLIVPDSIAAESQRSAFTELKTELGSPGAAARVADLAVGLMA